MLDLMMEKFRRCRLLQGIIILCFAMFLNGAKAKKPTAKVHKKKAAVSKAAVDEHAPSTDIARTHQKFVPEGRPWYEAMFADGVIRIAVFWGWDHPRETIEAVYPAFETLNGKTVYYKGHKARIEIGIITQVSDKPRDMFQAALEDPSIDIVIYSGHARYGGGMAFAERDDIFRSGNGEMVEDRHTRPFRYFKATAEDLEATEFPSSYRIVMLNCCDSEAHFRKSWSARLKECGAPVDLITVEYPVFNLYDNRRVLNFVQDLLLFNDWKTIKSHYDSEVHQHNNYFVVNPVFVPSEDNAEAAKPADANSGEESEKLTSRSVQP
ncbi:MAG: hypothetical protein HQM09_02215 [Candidatus Riflebacteria bacterium]|nr:hypothetical protein [Candidatus Riflebacteria bacterium]